MSAYYNEIDPFCIRRIRTLMRRGIIADGDVDDRSIADVQATDLTGFSQYHFFSGIGGWSMALRMSGWPDDRPVWTGSCPCQPFSSAGKQRGFADSRHLWPEFYRLISKCRPAIAFGEQVAGPAGRAWWDAVSADLEHAGYAVGAANLCAAGVGAPHIRQRLYWCALAETRWLVNSDGDGWASGARHQKTVGQGLSTAATGGDGWHGATDGFWRDVDWICCTDGNWRPVKPGIVPLVDGTPGRTALLRAIGNAIVPQVAAEFIGAVDSITGEKNG